MGQMLHDSRQPLVETGLAKHGFPPYGCGASHTPHYAVRREGKHLLFKKPPLVRGGAGGAAGAWSSVDGPSPAASRRRTSPAARVLVPSTTVPTCLLAPSAAHRPRAVCRPCRGCPGGSGRPAKRRTA